MSRRRSTVAVALGAAAIAVFVAVSGCAPRGAAPAAPEDPLRARLLGALPPDAGPRGVHLFVPDEAEGIGPGSMLAPVLTDVLLAADLVVETAAPPITLIAGVDEDVALPPAAERVDDVVVLGPPAEAAATAARLRAGARPEGMRALLAATDAPVGWVGPLPEPRQGGQPGIGPGEWVLTRSADRWRAVVRSEAPPAGAAELIRQRLATGSPPGSPGKPWSAVLADAEVSVHGGDVVVEAVPVDLPGPLLRALLDDQGFSFLAR